MQENIRLNYSYRDFANYKNHGSVIFSNPNSKSTEEVDATIREHLLLEDNLFLHEQWNIPDLHFEKTDWELDHPYHQYDSVAFVEEDSTAEVSIEEFLERIKQFKK